MDRAKAFYLDQLGFNVDYDPRYSGEVRWVQLTPPGSGCSIAIRQGPQSSGEPFDMPPGSLKGLQLVVPDVREARAELVERGVEVTGIQVDEKGPRPAPEGTDLDNVGFVHFNDPDGNTSRAPEASSAIVRSAHDSRVTISSCARRCSLTYRNS